MYFGRSLGSEWGRFFPLFSLFFSFSFSFSLFFPPFFLSICGKPENYKNGKSRKKGRTGIKKFPSLLQNNYSIRAHSTHSLVL